MKVYRYIRRSKDDIDVNNQYITTNDYCTQNSLIIYESVEELITGNSYHDDRALLKIINKLEKGDILIVADISRLGRIFLDMMEVGAKIMRRGARLIMIENNLELKDDIGSSFMFSALSLGSQMYRQFVSSKTKVGMKKAALEGKQIGRKKGEFSKKLDGKEKEVNDYLKKGLSVSAVAKLCDVTRQTMTKFIESIKEPAQ